MRCIFVAIAFLLLTVASLPVLAKTVPGTETEQNNFAPNTAKFTLTPVHFLARQPLAFGPFIVKSLSPQELRELAEEKQRRQQIISFGPAEHLRAARRHKPRH